MTAEPDASAPPERSAETPNESADATKSSVTEPTLERGDASQAESVDEATEDRPSFAPTSRASSGSSGKLLLALAAVVLGIVLFVLAKRPKREQQADVQPAATVAAVESPPATPLSGTPALSPPAPETPSAGALLEPAAASAPSAAEPIAAASTESVRSGEMIRVTLSAKPSGAKIYRHGKELGTNSVVVEFPPGEKRAFEVGLSGYVTRKVVVDGSTSELVVSLLPEKPTEAPAGSAAAAPAPTTKQAVQAASTATSAPQSATATTPTRPATSSAAPPASAP